MQNEHLDAAGTKMCEYIISCRRKQSSDLLPHSFTILIIPTDLEVNDNCKDKDGGNQIHEVGKVLTVKGLTKSSDFVCASGQKVEQSNDGSLKFHALERKRKR